MDGPPAPCVANGVFAFFYQFFAKMFKRKTVERRHTRLPPPTPARLAASLTERPHSLGEFVEQADFKNETVLYLAYGSNLCNETFRGRRGIEPLAQINVQVPSLRVTFDLPGIPYVEPCFANSGRRESQSSISNTDDEKGPLLGPHEQRGGYRKDQWQKGLIGVVYEVTAKDYAHIIATEGGGASYQDVVVDCHPFASDDPSDPVPMIPTTAPFKTHTLFAPALPPDDPPPDDGGRVQRPIKGYAQASPRYLKLIKDGAAELGLPYEYQDHLRSLRGYTITTLRQRIGQTVFLGLWAPILAFVFGLGKIFKDKKGRQPAWLRQVTGSVFMAVWTSYDKVFKPMFGDGERSLTDKEARSSEIEVLPRVDGRERTALAGQMASSELEKSVLVTQLV